MSSNVTPTTCPDRVAAVLNALGSPTRLALLISLLDHPYSVNKLADAIGAKHANVSQQLGILKQAGLVTSVQTGATVTYFTDGPEVNQLIGLTIELVRKDSTKRTA